MEQSRKISVEFRYDGDTYYKTSEKNGIIIFTDKGDCKCLITDKNLNILVEIRALDYYLKITE